MNRATQKPQFVAIIQARMGSTRLPGKVMADIVGQPMLHYVVSRARRAKELDLVAVATSNKSNDKAIVDFCDRHRIPCFCGSEDDVLDRYYLSATHFEADVVIRLTADCPLLDPRVIDDVVHKYRHGTFDYVSNTIKPTYPDGLDTEVFGYEVLEKTWREARLKSEREHVTPFIYNNPQFFRVHNVVFSEDLSDLRWTVDASRDLEFVRKVYAHLESSPEFGMVELVAVEFEISE